MKKFILIIICLLLGGCQKDIVYEDKTTDFLEIKKLKQEVYSDVFLNDILEIKNEDIKLLSENYQIDTTKLGKETLEVKYLYNKKTYLFKAEIEIVDTTPPLVFSGTTKSVLVNYDKDICNLITYGDNYSGDIKCTVTGNYDLKKVGTYNLLYTLSDSSNNQKEVNVTLNVVKKTTTTTKPSTSKTYFKDIYDKHKNDTTEIGIDVSKWQGDIDFSKVKAAGASFVMMRLGVQSTPNGELSVDAYYKENIKKAKEAGLKVGVYLYSIATTVEEAQRQADFVLKTLDGEALDLPIVFDWESWENWNSYKISFYEINNIANHFIEKVKEKGYQGMLYSSKFYLETIWTNKQNYPVWLAHYTSKTNYQGDYDIWQLCSNGRIDGIKGDVDIDIMYKNS